MLIDVLYTVLSALSVVSHVVQLFLEPYAVSQVLAFFEAFPLSPGYLASIVRASCARPNAALAPIIKIFG